MKSRRPAPGFRSGKVAAVEQAMMVDAVLSNSEALSSGMISGRGKVRGAFVVVCGPDGSGKTSLARELLGRVGHRGKYFHFIPSPPNHLDNCPPEVATSVEKNRTRGSRLVGFLRIVWNLGRAWTAYLMAIRPALQGGFLVVGDRWLYGYTAQPMALKFYGPEWVARLVLRVMPQPDLVVVLEAPSEVIYERKSELSLDEIDGERRQWSQVFGRKITLDARRTIAELCDETLARLGMGAQFRKYPPVHGHVLLPAASKAAALASSTLYTPGRSRGLLAQRVGRGLLRATGTVWLPMANPSEIPLNEENREALAALLAANDLQHDNIGLYTRRQDDRTGFSILIINGSKAVGFVRVGLPGELDMECRALELLEIFSPLTFHYPRLLDRKRAGPVDLILQTVVLEGYHRPPRRPPLDEIVAEIQLALGDFPKPPDAPDHWVPMHGDFTPWNLRDKGGQLSLIDWESVGWGPPLADQVFYIARSMQLGQRHPKGEWGPEAARFWLERLPKAQNPREARFGEGFREVLERYDPHG